MMKRVMTVLVVLAAMACTASAVTLGASPAEISFMNATRGSRLSTYLTLSTLDNDLDCSMEATGQVKEWTYLGEPSFTMDRGQRTVPVRFNIPEATPNGIYTGRILITASPKKAGVKGTGAVVGAGVSVKVTVAVGGSESLWYRVMRVNVHNTNEGQPIKVRLTLKNSAAQTITPKIVLKSLDHDRKNVFTASTFSDRRVEGLSRKTIDLTLPSGSMPPDLYWMSLKVEVDGESIWDSNEAFYVLPENRSEFETVKVVGSLDSARIENANLTVGEQLIVRTTFSNKGEVPLAAKMHVDFMKDGKLVKSLETPNEYYEVGGSGDFAVEYQPPEPGDYTARIWVEYAGMRTAVREAKVKVWHYVPLLFRLDLNFYLIALPVVAIIVLWIILYYRKYNVRDE
ncbi:MAG: hypothetical protein GF416_09040 [Candidatus Altiarchaeales archaeon]|nr:hypothetical protein [Candidatus Altiarchaeales archaeon]MBD3417263.1 hypothetical protein [Candidatus Altiarchaeales archaeon]